MGRIIKLRNRIFVDNSKVVTADVDATNGVVHVIDRVLIPPQSVNMALGATPVRKNIVELASGIDDLSTLVTALTAGKLTTALSGDGPFTVFAPTNEAFAALPKATLAHLLDPKNIKELDEILEYHVIAGTAIHAKDLKEFQKVKTLEGRTVNVLKRDGSVLVGNSKVVTADVDATNGVVHVINHVLIPPTMLLLD